MLLKCEAINQKYLEKPQNIFFIYGSEIVLKNNSKDLIKNLYLKEVCRKNNS
jgi:hypothetical protein